MSNGPSPISEYRTSRRIEFADTDLGGIVHFSRIFVFMETAEHELLRALGTSVHVEMNGRTIGWPRVEASCRYLAPLRFGDEVEIVLRVVRKGSRALTFASELRVEGRLCARGRMSSVCCLLDDPQGLVPIPIPEPLASRLAVAPEASVDDEPG